MSRSTYQEDVHLEVWHLGGKVGHIDVDQVSYYESIDLSPQEAAKREVERLSSYESGEDNYNWIKRMIFYNS